LWFAFASSAQAAVSVDPYYAGSYSVIQLGSAAGVPAIYGGLTLKLDDTGILLLGGRANTRSARIYSVALVRDVDDHITGFAGTATAFANANGVTGGIDGGLAYGPGDVLFYTSFPDNRIGQIKPGSAGPNKLVNLTSLGVTSSVGSLAFVPAGMPGAGRLKIVSYGTGVWYDGTVSPDATGTYNIQIDLASAIDLGSGLEGIVYVPAGQALFPKPSVLVTTYSLTEGNVASYEVDEDGDPIPGTRRTFLSGLTGALGAAVDPVTGDFLFSMFEGSDSQVLEVTSIPEPATWLLLALGLAMLVAGVRQRERTFGRRSSRPSLTTGLAELGKH
jgi:hypothetical protein